MSIVAIGDERAHLYRLVFWKFARMNYRSAFPVGFPMGDRFQRLIQVVDDARGRTAMPGGCPGSDFAAESRRVIGCMTGGDE